MPQKPLKVGKKIQKATNRHGKTPKTRKGKFDILPKKPKLLAQHKEQQELTKMINKNNESTFAGKAQQAGGHLAVVKAPAPVMASADQKAKAKASKHAQ